MGVGVLFGGHVVGEDGLHATAKNRQTNLGVFLCLGLDLPCTQTQKTKEARSCSISLALEGCLKPTFTPTLPTFSVLGIHIPDASWMLVGQLVPPFDAVLA